MEPRKSLAYYAARGDLEGVKDWIAARGTDAICGSRELAMNPPLYAAVEEGHFEVASYLLSLGVDPNSTNLYGHTPLMAAVRLYWQERPGQLDIVRQLIEHGASVNMKNNNGHTSLMEAAEGRSLPAAALLIESGAKVSEPNNFGITPLMKASRGGYLPMVKLLIEKGALVNEKLPGGGFPLMHAAIEGNVNIIEELVARGALVNDEDDGLTALHMASMKGWVGATDALLARGADPDAVGKYD